MSLSEWIVKHGVYQLQFEKVDWNKEGNLLSLLEVNITLPEYIELDDQGMSFWNASDIEQMEFLRGVVRKGDLYLFAHIDYEEAISNLVELFDIARPAIRYYLARAYPGLASKFLLYHKRDLHFYKGEIHSSITDYLYFGLFDENEMEKLPKEYHFVRSLDGTRPKEPISVEKYQDSLEKLYHLVASKADYRNTTSDLQILRDCFPDDELNFKNIIPRLTTVKILERADQLKNVSIDWIIRAIDNHFPKAAELLFEKLEKKWHDLFFWELLNNYQGNEDIRAIWILFNLEPRYLIAFCQNEMFGVVLSNLQIAIKDRIYQWMERNWDRKRYLCLVYSIDELKKMNKYTLYYKINHKELLIEILDGNEVLAARVKGQSLSASDSDEE